jgi:hypothetical protein
MRSGHTSEKERIVLFGHSAYFADDGMCVIPENTTLTLYSAPGALLDRSVAAALANSESITSDDLEVSTAEWAFVARGLPFPESLSRSEEVKQYPKTFVAGQTVPNLFLNPAEVEMSVKAISHVPTQVLSFSQTMQLDEILKQYAGQDIHWAACTFAKTPDDQSLGYGYRFTLKSSSPKYALYMPVQTEEEKLKRREQRFGKVTYSSDEGSRYYRCRLFNPSQNRRRETGGCIQSGTLSTYRYRQSGY